MISLSQNNMFIAYGLLTIAVLSICIFVFWQKLESYNLLMRRVNEIKSGEKDKQQLSKSDQAVSLSGDLPVFYQNLFRLFRLNIDAGKGDFVSLIRLAGYRGRSPIVKFMVIRTVSPAVTFILTFLYLKFALKLNQPLGIIFLASVGAGGLGWYGPLVFLKNRVQKRQKEIRRAWPETLDLLLICVEAGMGLESAFIKVSQEIGSQSAAMAEEIDILVAELSYLPDRRTAYDNLVNRTGVDAIKSAATSLIQAEKYGTALGQALRVLAAESREMRMSAAEAKAASLPPKLTVPMILFFLPVLFAVIISPAIIQISRVQ